MQHLTAATNTKRGIEAMQEKCLVSCCDDLYVQWATQTSHRAGESPLCRVLQRAQLTRNKPLSVNEHDPAARAME